MGYEIDADIKGSEGRLWKLLDERAGANADVRAIDERIWDLFGEEWTILYTDLSGFSRRVAEFGICHFLQIIHEQRQLFFPVIHRFDGILIKVEADSLMVIFRRPERALACTLELQRVAQSVSERRRPEEQILLCAGLGHGRILRIGDVDVFGAEVNAASKLGEDTARAHEILATAAFKKSTEGFPGVTFEPLGKEVAGSSENYRVLYKRVGQ